MFRMLSKYSIESSERCGLYPDKFISMDTSHKADILRQSANRILKGEITFTAEVLSLAYQLMKHNRLNSKGAKVRLLNDLRKLIKKADVDNKFTYLYNRFNGQNKDLLEIIDTAGNIEEYREKLVNYCQQLKYKKEYSTRKSQETIRMEHAEHIRKLQYDVDLAKCAEFDAHSKRVIAENKLRMATKSDALFEDMCKSHEPLFPVDPNKMPRVVSPPLPPMALMSDSYIQGLEWLPQFDLND